MYSYFEELIKSKEFKSVSDDDIFTYKKELFSELENMDAPEYIYDLVNNEMIETSIQNNHEPKEFAWAILQ